MPSHDDPLVADPPVEIPLPDAPLVRVVAQVRFPIIASIENQAFIAPFQEKIRDEYPVLRQEKIHGFVVGPKGTAQSSSQVIWRFHDLKGEWSVSLAAEFIALETTKYTSRGNFLVRLQKVLEALKEHFNPKQTDRLGVRYIDRVDEEATKEIGTLVRPEMLGILGTKASPNIIHSISESIFSLPNQQAYLKARWGHLPAGGTVDSAALEPVNFATWILDLDMFSEHPRPFDIDELLLSVRVFSERMYTFFRWSVTDVFLKRYGGRV